MDNPAFPGEPAQTSSSPTPVSSRPVSQPVSPPSSPPASNQLPSFIDLFKQAFRVFKSNWKSIVTLWGIFIGVTLGLSLVAGGVAFLAVRMGVDPKAILVISLVLSLPVMLAGVLFFTSHILLINDAVAGQPANALASLKQAFSKLGLIGFTQISLVLTVMGVAFIPILPVILGIGLMLTMFVALGENIGGYYALSRSWQLTKGYRTKMFLYGLYFFLIFLIVAVVGNFLVMTIVLASVALVINLAVFLVWMIFICLLYQNVYRLKQSEVFVKKINLWFVVSSVLAVIWIVVGMFTFSKFGTFSFNFSPYGGDIPVSVLDPDVKRFLDDVKDLESQDPAYNSSDPALAKYDQDTDGDKIPDFMEVVLAAADISEIKKINHTAPKNYHFDPLVKVEHGCGQGDCGESEVNDYEAKQTNVLIIFDASGSMAQTVGGVAKIEAAKQAVKSFVDNLNEDNLNLGLMVYGHKGSNSQADKIYSCSQIETLYSLAPVDKSEFKQAVDSFQATGWTPIQGALDLAPSVFAGLENQNNHIVLISDGIEQCDGDPVTAATNIKNSDFKLTVNIIGFDITSSDQQQLKNIANATGGNFINATNSEEILKQLQNQRDAWYSIMDYGNCLFLTGTETGNCIFWSYATAGNYSYNIANGKVDENISGPEKKRAQELARFLHDYGDEMAEKDWKGASDKANEQWDKADELTD